MDIAHFVAGASVDKPYTLLVSQALRHLYQGHCLNSAQSRVGVEACTNLNTERVMETEYSVCFQDTEGPSETVADELSFNQCIAFLQGTGAASRYGVTLWVEGDIEGQWNGEEWLDTALTGVEPG